MYSTLITLGVLFSETTVHYMMICEPQDYVLYREDNFINLKSRTENVIVYENKCTLFPVFITVL
jgi:hypothetical protein